MLAMLEPMNGSAKSRKVPGKYREVLAANVLALTERKYGSHPNLPRALAQDAKVSLSSVQRLLSKDVGATIDTIEACAKVLDVTPAELLSQGDAAPYVCEPEASYSVEVPLEAQLVHVLTKMKLLPEEVDELVAMAAVASARSKRAVELFGPAATDEQTAHIPAAPKLPKQEQRKGYPGYSTTISNEGKRVTRRWPQARETKE